MSSQQQRLRGVRVLKAISSAIRLQILNLLFDKGELSYTELMNLLKMSPSRDAGRFAYHLKFLLKANLIEVNTESKKYCLTDLGEMVLEAAEEIEKKSLKLQRLLVRTSQFTLEEFDVNRIVDSLVKEANMPVDQAKKVAKEAEKRLLKAKTKYLTAPLIREVVNGILIEKGLEEYRHKLTRLGLPVYDVSQILVKGKTVHSAHSICEEFGKNVLEEYTLLNVLPRDVADAHLAGDIHLEGLGCWILKPSEAVHDLRPFFKGADSSPFFHSPKSFGSALNITLNVLLHSAKEVDSVQVLGYFNVFLAPFLKSLNEKEVKELLRQFILNASQHADTSLNIELMVPDFLSNRPVAVPGTSGVYGDFQDECLHLARLVLEVLTEESIRRPLLNPRVVVNLRPETLKNDKAIDVLLNAHQLAADKGVLYFANLFEEKHTVFSPSGGMLKTGFEGDWEVNTLRTGVSGIATVNLPRITYECGGDKAKFFELLRERLEMAACALEIKFRRLKQNGKCFLLFLFQKIDGDQYFRLGNAVHLINLIGLEEAVNAFTGKRVHENEDSLRFALEIVQHAQEFLHEGEKRHGKRVLLSILPSKEASTRLARRDIERFGVMKTRFHGTRDKPHYSSFCRLNTQNLEVSLKTLASIRELYKQLEGGNLTVFELGEASYSGEELLALTRKFVESYGVPFFAYNRNLTYCNQCRKSMFGVLHKCPSCGSVSTLTVFRRFIYDQPT